MKAKAKRFAKYYDQCRLPKWVIVLGIVLLAFGIVAAGVTAIFHDKYSSIFGAWESALTNVWFIAFVALIGVGALISLGYPLLTAIGAGLWVLLSKPEPEVIEEQPTLEMLVVKEEAPAAEEKDQKQERVIINEARLRTIFDSQFMKSWSGELGKKYIDKVVEDLQFVRDNYRQGAKDNVHFANKHIYEIAGLLHKMKYFTEFTNTFTDLCCALFECLYIDLPERDNIKKYQEYSDQVKKRFYYLL
ncbi:MAG: hypothetical protein K6F06_01770 [Bacteroidales bacterium]|nr:hypothetical protein [Bacteroidales bacterium]